MYAVVDFKGTQFRVEKDQTLEVPFLKNKEIGTEIELDRVLFLKNDNDTVVGKPIIEKSKVIAEIIAHKKDKKIIVFKKKRRKGYEKKQGHRQNYTEIKIKDIIN
ncbi:MAG TPA: 50S ribosomal protein L21 [Candidatus Cloacimonetes bacterium]|nr:50S ribosomal protein L21 [Candidatus Cloacimonadota bacterium]